MSSSRTRRVLVVGGGAAGLSAAWFLAKRLGNVARVTLVEAAPRCGGWLMSGREHGFLFEQGARTLSPKPENAWPLLEMLRDLRLQDQLLAVPKQSKDSPNRNRYLLHGGQVTHVPTTPLAAMRAAVTRPVIAGLLNDIFMAQRRGGKGIGDSDGDDESVRSFFTRRFNAHVADALVGAFVNGIYGGDVGRWSMRALFPRLLDYEHASRSVVLGALRSALTTASPQAIALDRLSTFDDRALLEVWNRGAFLTLRDGVDTLAKRLEEDLQNDECAEVLTGTRCIEITRDANDDTLRCTLEDAETGRPAGVIQADHVVSAVPAFQLARMLDVGQSPGSTDGHGHRALLASDLVANLTAIPFVSIAPVNLAWDTLFPLPVRPTIGYLAPSVETVPELGVVFDAPFPFDQRQPYPSTVLTVILGGPSFAKATGRALDETSPERLLTIARDVVARRLGIAAAPSAHHVALHRQSMPQYNVGHVARVGRIQQAVDSIYDGRLHLAGASYRGIGVPDCIQSGYNVAQAVATDMLAEEH